MATQVQFRGGTTSEHSSFNGVAKEVTVDTTKQTLVVQDGSTNGGFPLLREKNPDGQKVYFGDGDDFQIWHQTADNRTYLWEKGSGAFCIQGSYIKLQSPQTDPTNASEAEVDLAVFKSDAGVELFYSGATTPKFETTSVGAKITGRLVLDGGYLHIDGSDLYLNDDKKAYFGGNSDLQIFHSNNDETNRFYLSGKATTFWTGASNNHAGIKITSGEAPTVELFYDNKRKFRTVSDGCEINSEEGEAAILSLVADEGDDWNDYSRIRGSQGDMFIELYNGTAWEKAAQFIHGGSAQLFFDAVKKFETSGTGCKISNTTANVVDLKFHYSTNSGYSLIQMDDGNNLILDCDPTQAGSNSNIQFKVDGDTALTLGSALNATFAGNVGIGTSPDTLLHLAGADTAVIRLENTDTSLVADQIIGGLEFEKQDPSGAGVGIVGGMRMYSGNATGQLTYLTFSTSNDTTNNVEALRLDESQKATFAGEISYPKSTPDGTITTNIPASTNAGDWVTIIPTGTSGIVEAATYIVRIWWHFNSQGNYPYYCGAGTIWVPVNSNDSSSPYGNSVKLLCSHHDAGFVASINVRVVAGSSVLSGLQATTDGWNPAENSQYRIEYKRIM